MSYDELEVRDARRWSALSPKPEPKPKPKPQPELKPDAEHRLYTVSYTHLTLPTTSRV